MSGNGAATVFCESLKVFKKKTLHKGVASRNKKEVSNITKKHSDF